MYNKKVRRGDLLILLFSIMMIRPYYIQLYEQINRVWAYSTLILALFSLLLIILKKRVKHVLAEALFLVIYIIGTLFSYPTNILSAISIVGQASLGYNIGILSLTKEYHYSVEKVVPRVFSVYLYLDALSVFLGISTNILHVQGTMTLLGYDNYAAFYVLPMLAVKLGLSYKNKGHLSKEDWLCWGGCTLAKIITASYAASLVLILFAVLYCMANKRKSIRKKVSIRNALLLVVLLFIGIYFFNIQYVIARFLVFVGKGVELNSRTVIWRYVMNNISMIPLVGLGNNTPEEFLSFFNFPYGWTATHAHNIILDLIIQTGIFGVIAYLNVLRELKIKCMPMRNKWYEIYIIGIVCYIILGLFDFYFYLPAFWLLVSLTKSEVIFYQKRLPLLISTKRKTHITERTA